MLGVFLAMMAATMNGAAPAVPQAQVAVTQSVPASQSDTAIGGGQVAAPADNATGTTAFNMAVVPAGLNAEAQTPSGKFTTAGEVKPILNATKGSWVALREFDGQDLLYVTHLWAWRCGLKAMAISVNSETMQNWPLPPCHVDSAMPNAVLPQDGVPYLTLRLGAVQNITIQLVYDDLSMDVARFARKDVLLP